MFAKYVKSQKYLDSKLGYVNIRVNSNARRFIARWKNDTICITIPERTTLQEYERVIAELAPKILAMRPEIKSQFYDEYCLEFDLWRVTVIIDPKIPSAHIRSGAKKTPNEYYIVVSPDWDFNSSEGNLLIQKHIKGIAEFVTRKYILDEARTVANELNLSDKVKSWSVGRGDQRLGCCTSSGKISLSRKLAFMPRELRRHIITHELAHLTHCNHSPEFHALWQTYDGDKHLHLRKTLKQLKFPF